MNKGSRMKFYIPLLIFSLMAIVLALGLNLDPRYVPSPLIGRPAPPFSLPILDEPGTTLAVEDMRGEPWVLNVWASWCVACLTEHPVLNQYAARKAFKLVGLNYKDEPSNGMQWLEDRGDPYDVSISDLDGMTGIDWGVYGVPETFVIDADGIIQYKHIGPVSAKDIEQHILPWFDQSTGS
jgi:cytochrome c biogenesis protein CcmG/thiol:disulfide interchange protein DsbE